MNQPATDVAMEGGEWVDGWLAARFGDSSLTAKRYRAAWCKLQAFLAYKGIVSLLAITRQACFDYLLWRNDVSRNTATTELKVLAIILHEAVLRGIISANPCVKLGIRKSPPAKVKPDIPRTILDEIAACIEKETGKLKDFFRISFAIARYHGCRIAETKFALSCVDFDTDTLTFHQKGGKANTVPLHPALRPVLLELKQAGKTWTFTKPAKPGAMSVAWIRFWRKHGFDKRIPFVCFHSLRIATVTALARGGISEQHAMRYVGHSSDLVHRCYLRTKVDDLRSCCDAL